MSIGGKYRVLAWKKGGEGRSEMRKGNGTWGRAPGGLGTEAAKKVHEEADHKGTTSPYH